MRIPFGVCVGVAAVWLATSTPAYADPQRKIYGRPVVRLSTIEIDRLVSGKSIGCSKRDSELLRICRNFYADGRYHEIMYSVAPLPKFGKWYAQQDHLVIEVPSGKEIYNILDGGNEVTYLEPLHRTLRVIVFTGEVK